MLITTSLRRLSVLSGDKDYDFASVSSRSEDSSESSHYVGATNTFFEETLSKSFLLSADMAHCTSNHHPLLCSFISPFQQGQCWHSSPSQAVHPNYPAKYESDHRPEMNKGPVIKINANARYATNSPGIVLVQECARTASVPLQLFVVRNDSSCGSTIGPMLSAKLGMRTLDMGNAYVWTIFLFKSFSFFIVRLFLVLLFCVPFHSSQTLQMEALTKVLLYSQLSMHSISETGYVISKETPHSTEKCIHMYISFLQRLLLMLRENYEL